MRRLLNEARRYLADLIGASRWGWNNFFFAPSDPTTLGLIRVGTGLLAFWSLFVLGLDLHDYFGADGWAEPSAIHEDHRPFLWSLWYAVPEGGLRLAWAGCLAVLALWTIGLFSRTTAVLSWVIVVSTIHRVPVALYGFDQILSPLCLYLAVTGASGQAVSLDRFLRRWRQSRAAAAASAGARPSNAPPRRVSPDDPAVPAPSVSANLALRLIQLQLLVIYGIAGLGKLQGPSWWNGMALWGTMTAGEFVVLDFTSLSGYPWLINAMTHVSLALELLYPVLVWVRITRPLMLVGIVGLHIGIAAMSPGLTEFSLAMMTANMAFVSGRWLRGLAADPDRASLRVLYDGACPRCRASMALVTAADPAAVVEPVDLTAVDVRTVHPSLTPEACLHAMHAVSGSGGVWSGFDAVRAIAGRLPMAWPLAAAAFLPGVAPLARIVYNHVAAGRPRDVPCTDRTCGLHSGAARTAPRLLRGRATDPNNSISTPADSRETPHP
ncbi:MAG: DCC1-like thiol-disulfide oxidoreductase family protein [Isosphaeraceae bacterium]